MDKRRTIVISIAVLLAVIAGGAVFLFLKDSSDSSTAVEGQKSALVATRALPASTRASQIVDTGGFKIVNQPESNVPNDAILTLEQLNAIASEGKVLISAVPETTVLRASSFGAPGDSISSVNGALAADEQLITIPSASIRGISAGLLKPGDHVNGIITTLATGGTPAQASGSSTTSVASTASTSKTGYLFQNLEVYAIGSTTTTTVASAVSPTGATAAPSTTSSEITFRVNLVEATKLIAALHGGAQTQDIWLTLVSQDFESVPAPAIVNELLTDNYVKDSLVKEPASPAIPVKPKATSSSSSAAGK